MAVLFSSKVLYSRYSTWFAKEKFLGTKNVLYHELLFRSGSKRIYAYYLLYIRCIAVLQFSCPKMQDEGSGRDKSRKNRKTREKCVIAGIGINCDDIGTETPTMKFCDYILFHATLPVDLSWSRIHRGVIPSGVFFSHCHLCRFSLFKKNVGPKDQTLEFDNYNY